jgi:hypothetical protein
MQSGEWGEVEMGTLKGFNRTDAIQPHLVLNFPINLLPHEDDQFNPSGVVTVVLIYILFIFNSFGVIDIQ